MTEGISKAAQVLQELNYTKETLSTQLNILPYFPFQNADDVLKDKKFVFLTNMEY